MEIMEVFFDRIRILLEQHGFDKSFFFRDNLCFDFYRYHEKKADFISFSYVNDYGNFLLGGNFTTCVALHEVNKILSNVINMSAIENLTIAEFPLYNKNYDSIINIENTVISTDNVDIIISELIFFFQNNFFPFFDKVTSIQVVNDEIINKIPHMELGQYIPGKMPLKKQIIMKLCENPQYNDYIGWLEKIYLTALEDKNNIRYKNYEESYRGFQLLSSVLESGEYKKFLTNNEF
jgi:hypothetical protein